MCIGTSNEGFLIFETSDTSFNSSAINWSLAKKYDQEGGCSIVCCNANKMVITAGLSGEPDNQENSARLAKIYKVEKDTSVEITRIPFETTILKIHLIEKFLIFVLENDIQLFDAQTLTFLNRISTGLNSRGVYAVSANSHLLAFPKVKAGKSEAYLTLYDIASRQEKREIATSHIQPLEYIQFNHDGSLIATAPQDGLLITVYSVLDGSEKYIFRRATMQTTQICSMAFNNDKNAPLLAVASSKGTVHIFDLKEGQIKSSSSITDSGLYASTAKIIEQKTVGNEARSFCVVRLQPPVSSAICFSANSHKIVTLGHDGKVECWDIIREKTQNVFGQELASDARKGDNGMDVTSYFAV